MLESASGDQHGHVSIVVVGRVAEVAGEEDGGVIQQIAMRIAVLAKSAKEFAPLPNHGFFDECELFELGLVAAVVTE